MAQQESRHTFSSSGLDETMYLKVIDDWSPCIILLLGHSGGFAEWNELIHETLPIDDVPSEILLEILGLAGRGIHPIDAEPAAFRRSSTIQEKLGFRIVERCVDGSTRFHEREFGAYVFRLAVRRVQVLDCLHRAPKSEQFNSDCLHLAVVRQRKHVTDPIEFLKIVIRVFQKPIEISASLLAMYGDAGPMRSCPALLIAECNPHIDSQCQKRQGRGQQCQP